MEFVRDIDTTRVPKPTAKRSRVHTWREAWIACHRVVDQFNAVDLKQFHCVFERWVPLLNRAFDDPIQLDRYSFTFYYCDESVGPKEILQLYMDESTTEEGKTCVYVVFHVHKFRQVHKTYCDDYSRNNRLLVDEARGTVHLSGIGRDGCGVGAPPQYFKSLATWIALFSFTMHAMAHLEAFDRTDHAHYDTHMIVRDSVFYKLVVYGVLGRLVNVK